MSKFYGLTWFQNVSGYFLQFAETCLIKECSTFTSCIISTYGKSIMECSPLTVLWLVLAQPEHSHCLVYQIFGKKYVCLSGEIVVIEQREEFDTDAINALEIKYSEYRGRIQSLDMSPLL